MESGDKVAAAILAAEAARQKVELSNASAGGRPNQGYDISGALLGYYHHFLSQVSLSAKKG